MSFKRYSGGAWQDIQNVRKYIGGSWQDCDSVKKYSGGIWTPVWENKKYITFGYVNNRDSSTNPPEYSYTPMEVPGIEGYSMCEIHLKRNYSQGANTAELSMNVPFSAAPDGECHIEFEISQLSSNALPNYKNFAVYAYPGGTLLSAYDIHDGVTDYNFTAPSVGICSMAFVPQVYGDKNAYFTFYLSHVFLNGEMYYFK